MQPWDKIEGSIRENQWLRELQKGKRPSCLKGRNSEADCPFPPSAEEELCTQIIKTSFVLMEGRPWEMDVALCVRVRCWLLVPEMKAI